jgi:tetratricopeptide (TPR) repeat protein
MPPPVSAKGNATFVPEPNDDGVVKDGPISSATVIVYANMCVEMVAKEPNKPSSEREQLLTQARTKYQEVLQREPKNVDALTGLGQLYQVSGEADKLKEIMQKATSLHSNNAKVWAWVAKEQAMVNNWPAAIDAYSHASKIDPDNRLYRIHLGFTLARAGRYPEGYECLSRCMREAEARYNLASMMIYNGEMEKAKMELRLAMLADPNFHAAGEKLASMQNPGVERGNDVRTVANEEVVIPPQPNPVQAAVHEQIVTPMQPTGPLIRQADWPQPSTLFPRTGGR